MRLCDMYAIYLRVYVPIYIALGHCCVPLDAHMCVYVDAIYDGGRR